MPAFMPVGTQGTVKGLTVDQLRATGSQMILANTYHLAVRPGEQTVRQLGGLHAFSGWSGPMLTDSGGFQIFSLAQRARVTDEGVSFRSHVDGAAVRLSPERVVAIQEALGSDIAMVLDHVVSLPSAAAVVREACRRTICWAERSLSVTTRADQALFGIVQGGMSAQLRRECASQLAKLDFAGYAIGGLSVGETPQQMVDMLAITCPHLPTDRPRYLMGVGRPQDLLEAIYLGVDMFDCVMPTRNGRNALAFTDRGTVRLRNRQYADDTGPLDPACPCSACRHSRGYLRHLFVADEMLGPILVSIHNVTYYQRLMADAREAITVDRLGQFKEEKMRQWGE